MYADQSKPVSAMPDGILSRRSFDRNSSPPAASTVAPWIASGMGMSEAARCPSGISAMQVNRNLPKVSCYCEGENTVADDKRSDGYIDLKIELPDMPNDIPATDKQKEAVRRVLTDAYDPSELTMGQAFLILDVTAYINGIFEFFVKNGILQELSDVSGQVAMRLVAFEAIMADETLWRGVHQWGRAMYSFGKSTRSPDLDPQSKLFQNAARAFFKHAREKADEIEKTNGLKL